MFILELLVVLGALAIGARVGGIGLGVWGGVGLAVLTFGFGAPPTSPPIDVMLIIIAVITAASVMEAAGGIDWLVSVAERIIRANPKNITLVAPLVTWGFTFAAGTGHIVYPLLPVIYGVAHENGIRPERPIAIATIASQQAITASPVSAATAVMIGLLAPQGLGLLHILAICVPATLLGVLIAALVQTRIGKELKDDPEYQRRLQAGEVERPKKGTASAAVALPKGAKTSAIIFLVGVAVVVLAGAFPDLRPTFVVDGKPTTLGMPAVIEMIMLAVAAIMVVSTGVKVGAVPATKTSQAGTTAVVGIMGLAWMGDTFIAHNRDIVIGGLSGMAQAYPILFALGLFLASVLLYSQAATARALMPLGLQLGLRGPGLIGAFPAVNGYFLLPNYGTIIAAINFDRSGTTGIGKYVLNHSFMIPGMVATWSAVLIGLIISRVFF
ncbi:MAG TPA: anaerobic C4-dicarboxylate transporter [Methylomirabilota bacterium]|nr:anaerobic C4-dicarboxylate transporter [Methylomirabilota bacterium]